MAADSIIKMSRWIDRQKGQTHLSPSIQWSPPTALVSLTLLKKMKTEVLAIRWEGLVHQVAGMGACFWCKACMSWETLSLLQPAAREGYVGFFSLWTLPINSFIGSPFWKTLSFCPELWSSPSTEKNQQIWRHLNVHGHFHRTWMPR